MELGECEEFVQRATARFREFAAAHGYVFEGHTKSYFWIRHPGRTEVFQGNYVTSWLRGFMHHLTAADLQRLRFVQSYRDHCREFPDDGWQFRVATEEDIKAVMEIILARCGS